MTAATLRPPVPPFTQKTALRKVRLAKDGWNSRDPQRVALVYTEDSEWRSRAEIPLATGTAAGRASRPGRPGAVSAAKSV